MGRVLKFVAFLALVSVPAAALDGRLTLGAIAGWAIMLGALSGPMYLAPRQYAEWTRRCRLPRLLRPVDDTRSPRDRLVGGRS